MRGDRRESARAPAAAVQEAGQPRIAMCYTEVRLPDAQHDEIVRHKVWQYMYIYIYIYFVLKRCPRELSPRGLRLKEDDAKSVSVGHSLCLPFISSARNTNSDIAVPSSAVTSATLFQW